MLRFIFIGLPLLLVFLFAVAFGALNKNAIPFNFILGEITLPVAVLTGLFIGLGFLLGIAAMAAKHMALRAENRKLRKQMMQRESSNA